MVRDHRHKYKWESKIYWGLHIEREGGIGRIVFVSKAGVLSLRDC